MICLKYSSKTKNETCKDLYEKSFLHLHFGGLHLSLSIPKQHDMFVQAEVMESGCDKLIPGPDISIEFFLRLGTQRSLWFTREIRMIREELLQDSLT